MATIKSEVVRNVTAYADACLAGFTGSYSAWCAVLGAMSGDTHAVTIQKVHYTLRANAWAGNIYSFESVYPSSEYLFLFVDKDGDNITDEQVSWWYAADMMGSTDNKIYAHEEVPEVDIPVIITLIRLVTLGD